jgi:hypothetical protein
MKYSEWPQNIPNGRILPLQDPTTLTQMRIFWFENIQSGNPGLKAGGEESTTRLKISKKIGY